MSKKRSTSNKKKKIIISVVLIVTLLIGAAGLFTAWYLSRREYVSPEESEAAAEEVWNAERVRTPTQIEEFKEFWDDVEDGWEENNTGTAQRTAELIDYATCAKKAPDSSGESVCLGARFDPEAEILKVQNETLYGADLNYVMAIYSYRLYTDEFPLPEDDVAVEKGGQTYYRPGLNSVLDELMSQSIIIQESLNNSIVTETELSGIYNSKTKDRKLRNEKVQELTPQLEDLVVQKITGESISLWYDNNVIPSGDKQTGCTAAYEKIKYLYDEVKAGNMTMKEAGQMIQQDSVPVGGSIPVTIDPDFESNAYYKFEGVSKDSAVFTSRDLNTELWSLGSGQVSKIIEGGSTGISRVEEGSQPSCNNSYFIVVSVTNRSHNPDDPESIEMFVDSKSSSGVERLITK